MPATKIRQAQYSEWDVFKSKAADQDVTNSAVLANDNTLSFPVVAGETWIFELLIIYSGNTVAGDFKCDFVPSAGNMTGHYSYLGSDTAADVVNVSTGVRLAAAATMTAIAAGTAAAHTTKRTLKIEAMITFSANATVNFRFAQNTATAATVARMCAGSVLRAEKLA